MSTPARRPAAGLDLTALDAITDAVESGAGLPEVVRAAARALDASLVLIDRGGAVLAVAARSPADEHSLMSGGAGVEALDLRVGDQPVGALRMRVRPESGPPSPAPDSTASVMASSAVRSSPATGLRAGVDIRRL